MPWVYRGRRAGRLSGESQGRKGERFFALTPQPPLRPCPPTAAVLAQMLVRSPDFSVCKCIVDGCVVLISGIEGLTSCLEQQVIGLIEARDGRYIENHAVAPA